MQHFDTIKIVLMLMPSLPSIHEYMILSKKHQRAYKELVELEHPFSDEDKSVEASHYQYGIMADCNTGDVRGFMTKFLYIKNIPYLFRNGPRRLFFEDGTMNNCCPRSISINGKIRCPVLINDEIEMWYGISNYGRHPVPRADPLSNLESTEQTSDYDPYHPDMSADTMLTYQHTPHIDTHLIDFYTGYTVEEPKTSIHRMIAIPNNYYDIVDKERRYIPTNPHVMFH